MQVTRLEALFASLLGAAALGARGGCGPGPCHPVKGEQYFRDPTPDETEFALLLESQDPFDLAACKKYCDNEIVEACRRVGGGGVPVRLQCDVGDYERCEGAGRMTAGLYVRRGARGDRNVVAQFFGRMAWLEAASVLSFRRLRAELERHGAPRLLLRGASRAAADEVVHAAMMTRLARSHGVEPATPALNAAKRPLGALAVENAREGCAGETYGALVVAYQAKHAASHTLRRVFGRIARDELRHAALSWTIARWCRPRLSERERRDTDVALRESIATLDESAANHDPVLVAMAGLPNAEAEATLRKGLAQALRSMV